jgi:chromosome segregation protein
VYIKHIELSRFKSFGGTTPIPILPGFTVVSGPNGSGKSNILDALLFALGLSSSKGMRAERLPDLVNQAHSQKGRTVEASVKVVFALDEEDILARAAEAKDLAAQTTTNTDIARSETPEVSEASETTPQPAEIAEIAETTEPQTNPNEWAVTRKLRVTSQGTYTSTYYINDRPCNLSELHEELAKLRIYPEGYNVVLQGDVTSIISMNSRDRREIIDELAGVGEFDRKIDQAKQKLDDVKDQEDRFRIVEQELITNQEKLKSDRVKAEKYQMLRAELESLIASEVVLQHRQLLQQKSAKQTELHNCQTTATELKAQITELGIAIATASTELEALNAKVRTLGEEEYLAVSTEIASKNAEFRSMQRQHQEFSKSYQTTQNNIVATQVEIDDLLKAIEQLGGQQQVQEQEIKLLSLARDKQVAVVEKYRRELQAIASSANDWMKQQAQFFQTIETLQQTIDPQRQEHTRLKESLRQWSLQLANQETELAELQELQGQSLEEELNQYQSEASNAQTTIQSVAASLSAAQTELQTTKETIERLTQEQRVKGRQLDKLDAQVQATNEAQGTRATQLVLEANIPGVYGLVAQLGMVDPKYQLALEIAAGNRLAHVVVESDEVAAKAINLLKQERGGRATFLPLNKLKPARDLFELDPKLGAIAYALDLVEFDPRYEDVFGYIFGNTLVFERLDKARSYIGRHRMVTLDGDLLETTGAMTGGSTPMRGGIHFGTIASSESSEMAQLRDRLMEIDRLLVHLNQQSNQTQAQVANYEEQLQNARTAQREAQIQCDRLTEQINRTFKGRDRLQDQMHQNRTAIEVAQAQITSLEGSIAELEMRMQAEKAQLAELEKSGTHQRWQKEQEALQLQEQQLNTVELSLRAARQQFADWENQSHLTTEKINQRQLRLHELRASQTDLLNQSTHTQTSAKQLEEQIASLQVRLNALEQTIGTAKSERDACDRALRDRQSNHQQLTWQLEKNRERQAELTEQLVQLEASVATIELPEVLPEIPESMTLEQLQLEQRRLQKRLQSMEPVNMMAISEYEATTARLNELSARLETLNQERTELLLRIENFTTLRQRAFMQAFDAVNEHFKTIFAELSDGDGHLQLEHPSAPLSGGLNLVAHPKGKPVQHLASMSGGEKSLTALSFIFALQRYRPSPFYAFDEVDMFLDGANVERLAKMVRKQAEMAQFIVVSLRRPMIDCAERTIGVTQARGAHTQVLGFELRSS